MAVITTLKNFWIEAPDAPLVDRLDGGHVVIHPSIPVSKRQDLTYKLACELMQLTIIVGQAMEDVLKQSGIPIGRINYQDNGNWSVFSPGGPLMHIHLFGRATNARIQTYGEALYFPHREKHPAFYERNAALLPEESAAIRKQKCKTNIF